MSITLDSETADMITVDNLKHIREYLKNELLKIDNDEWIHPDDEAYNLRMVRAINVVLKYFGHEE